MNKVKAVPIGRSRSVYDSLVRLGTLLFRYSTGNNTSRSLRRRRRLVTKIEKTLGTTGKRDIDKIGEPKVRL